MLVEIYEKFLYVLYDVGREVTSDSYMEMLLGTVFNSLYDKYKFLEKIVIDGGNVDMSGVGLVKKKEGIQAMIDVYNIVNEPFSKMATNSFSKMIQSELDDDVSSAMKKAGLNI